MKYITSIFIIFGALLFQPNLIMAQSDMDQFEVKVEGLGCPFCAYGLEKKFNELESCLLYTSPSPRDQRGSRMPSSA